MSVTAWEEHAGDSVQEHRRVFFVDEEWSEGLFGADDAAHSGEKAVPFHIRYVSWGIRSCLYGEG